MSSDGRRVAAHAHSGAAATSGCSNRTEKVSVSSAIPRVSKTTRIRSSRPMARKSSTAPCGTAPGGSTSKPSMARATRTRPHLGAVDGADELVARRPFHRVLGQHWVRVGAAACRRANAFSAHRGMPKLPQSDFARRQLGRVSGRRQCLGAGFRWRRAVPVSSKAGLFPRWRADGRGSTTRAPILRNGHGGGGYDEPGLDRGGEAAAVVRYRVPEPRPPEQLPHLCGFTRRPALSISRPEPDTLVS